MKIYTSDKFIAWSTLLSGLTISAVAIYYSVAGLVAIFSAAVIPIIVMGVALEISKLAGTVWLKQNWNRAPYFIRAYLLAAIAILMLITSMGIFGFLSKAHSDQSLVSGDVQSRIAIYDEKIKTSKDNIEANRKALRQMDEAVDQVMGRSQDEKGADKAVAIRRGQQKERARLQAEITAEQKTITALSEERAPIAAEVRKVEAEVGPIKYIANFIYGDNPDANVLEKAVTWVIIIIVVVFDPLAVILLLASQYSFQWFRKQDEESNDLVPEPIEHTESEPKEDDFKFLAEDKDLYPEDNLEKNPPKFAAFMPSSSFWPFPRAEKTDNKLVEEAPYHPGYEDVTVIDDAGMTEEADIEEPRIEDTTSQEESELERWNKMIEEAERAVEVEKEQDDHEIIEEAAETEKQAMKQWKHEHPEGSLKLQRRLFATGKIDKLPWETSLKAEPDFTDDEAAEEAAKWALEQVEKKKQEADERPGDYLPNSEITWMEHDEAGNQIKKTKDTYQQNAEQSENTLWQRIQDAKK